jgi:hypothetical protein
MYWVIYNELSDEIACVPVVAADIDEAIALASATAQAYMLDKLRGEGETDDALMLETTRTHWAPEFFTAEEVHGALVVGITQTGLAP